MEGYQGNNSNTPYALFHLCYMDVNHALSQRDMLHTFFENNLLDNSIWVLCNIECISVMRNLLSTECLFVFWFTYYRFSRTCILSIWLTVNGYTVMTLAKPLNRFPLYSILLKSILTTQLNF